MTKQLRRYLALAIATILLAIACSPQTQLQNTQVEKLRSPVEENVLQIWWDIDKIIDKLTLHRSR